MRKQPNKKMIGAFILTGILTFAVILAVALGLGARHSNRTMYVMYFHESIKGLSVGSPVVLNGVEVGKVAKIEIVPNIETHDFSIPVYVTFNNIQKTMAAWSGGRTLDEEEVVSALVSRGLHAQLINQNLLTGQLMIELDMKPAKVTRSLPPGDDDIYEIPTVLSSLSEISSNIQNIPFKDLVDNLNHTLIEVKEVLAPAASVSQDVAKKTNVTLNNFNQAIQDVSRAANSLRNLTDYLEQHPESLIRGK